MPDNFRQQNKTLQLAEHFFNPRIIEIEEVFDGLLRGLATQTSQKMDINLISDVSMALNTFSFVHLLLEGNILVALILQVLYVELMYARNCRKKPERRHEGLFPVISCNGKILFTHYCSLQK